MADRPKLTPNYDCFDGYKSVLHCFNRLASDWLTASHHKTPTNLNPVADGPLRCAPLDTLAI